MTKLAGIIDRYLEPPSERDLPEYYAPSRCPVCRSQDIEAGSEIARDVENGRSWAEFSFKCNDRSCNFETEDWDGTEANLMAQAIAWAEEEGAI